MTLSREFGGIFIVLIGVGLSMRERGKLWNSNGAKRVFWNLEWPGDVPSLNPELGDLIRPFNPMEEINIGFGGPFDRMLFWDGRSGFEDCRGRGGWIILGSSLESLFDRPREFSSP